MNNFFYLLFFAATRSNKLNLIPILMRMRHYPRVICITTCNPVHPLNSFDIAMLCAKQSDWNAADEPLLPP